ncbi:MAG: hypothetical protein ACE5FV_06080, partial [Woeseia sp.]
MKRRYKITGGILIILVVAIAALGVVLSYDAACEPGPALADDAETMRAIRYRCYGSPEVLELEDVGKPVPG